MRLRPVDQNDYQSSATILKQQTNDLISKIKSLKELVTETPELTVVAKVFDKHFQSYFGQNSEYNVVSNKKQDKKSKSSKK